MEELRRIFGSRKFIGVLLFLLALNAWFTWNAQKPDKEQAEYYQENYEGDYIREENEKYQTFLRKYQNMDTDSAAQELSAYFEAYWEKLHAEMEQNSGEREESLKEEDIERQALASIQRQLEYIQGFEEYLQGIDESAEKMRQVSVLGTEGSFSRRNIDKTVKDFAPLKSVELKLDNERAIGAFVKCTLTGMFLMAMAVITVLIMLEERKKGLWQFVYSMPNGRSRMAAIRCAAMFLSVSLSGILLEGENLLITGIYYGGFGDLSRAVQSNPDFSGCVLTVSMGTYLALVIFSKILVCAFMGLVFWTALSSLRSHTGAFAVLAVFVAGEYYAYTQIGVQSPKNQYRYMNLFGFLDSGYALTDYHNLNFFGNPVSVHTLLLTAVPVLLVLIMVLTILLGRQKPFSQKESLATRLYERIIFILKPYRHNCIFLHECYKVFIKQKCALLVAALAVVSFFSIHTEEIYYDYATTIYNSYIAQIKGPVTEEKINYLASERELWQEKIEASTQKIERYNDLLEQGMDDSESLDIFVSSTEYEQELKKIEQYEKSEDIVAELLSLAERLEDLNREGGNTGFVNKIGYEMYFGSAGNVKRAGEALLSLAFLIASLAGIQSYEESQNAEKFIKTAKRGRNFLYKRKCAVAAVVTLLVFLPPAAVGFYNVYQTYGMEEFKMAAQSLDEFAGFPVHLSLGAVTVLVWTLRYVMLLGTAMMILFLSGRTKNMMISTIVCVLALLAPAGLVYMGFSAVSFLSVLRALTVTYFWNRYEFDGILWILPCIVILVIGIAAWRLGKRDAIKALE